jgi:molecular chaperone IbpA
MALAGFSKNDIEVEVAEGLLTIRSIKENDENDTDIYRGISYRKFNRKFTLADDIVVNDASLENGMLNITLERIVPEERKPRLIKVK